MEQFVDLNSVLIFFAFGGGSQWLMGVVQARLLENWVFWHKINPRWKKLITMALSGVVAWGFTALIDFDVVSLIPAFLAPVILGFVNWYFSQKEYGAIKVGDYAEKTILEANGG